MVPLTQFALLLVLAAGSALLVASLARRAAPARARRDRLDLLPRRRAEALARRRGGDPVAFPLRRRPG